LPSTRERIVLPDHDTRHTAGAERGDREWQLELSAAPSLSRSATTQPAPDRCLRLPQRGVAPPWSSIGGRKRPIGWPDRRRLSAGGSSSLLTTSQVGRGRHSASFPFGRLSSLRPASWLTDERLRSRFEQCDLLQPPLVLILRQPRRAQCAIFLPPP
jgi:hypothetical protein